ncbi:MAG: site-specific integrase [Gammaproteobacteria bacterium]|nr:site-specific integrase [Gammaproteobacteria bacterium]
MATFRKRAGTWRAEVYIKGTRASATFTTKREAQAWAAQEETKLREDAAGKVPNRPFRDLLERYSREVSAKKQGAAREQKMINVILRDSLVEVSLRMLAPTDIAAWRDRRLQQVTGATVEREMTILSHACSVARREWGWLRVNPVSSVRRPPPTPARTRRPTAEETERLLHALGYSREMLPETASARVGAAYLFAIETAMRAAEICSLEWQHVNERHLHLPQTKNGYARDVPLSAEARRIIEQLRCLNGSEGTVFGLSTAILDALFRKAKKRALIEDLHFHDTRREALTRLSKVFDVLELARISGHRDLRVLQNVYYAPSAEDLAAKLN